MKRNFFIVWTMMLLTTCATLVSVFAQQKFEVLEKGKIVATVSVERTEQVKTLTISRKGEPSHIYRSYPFVSAFSLSIGKEQILTYYSKTRQIELKDATFSLADLDKETADYGREDVKTLYQQVSDDMRVLRTVRETMPSIRFFETALVILTGNRNFLEGEPLETLTVSKDVAFVKTSAKAQTDPLERCHTRCQNTERRCVGSAGGNQQAISSCYENSFRCQENCERVYGQIQP